MAMLTTKYHVTRSFLRIGLLITGILSLIIGLLAFFGQNMGTFVISLGDDTYNAGIILSDTKDFKTAVPRLLVNPKNNAYPVSYTDLKIDQVKETDGDYDDPDKYTYIGYTFYLKNNGTSITDISFTITISTATKGVDKCVRVMLIEDDEDYYVFMKHDDRINMNDATPKEICYDFLDDSTICRSMIRSFRPNERKKYSLLIWLEGYDEDCVNSVRGGQLRMEMTFNIIRSVVEEDE